MSSGIELKIEGMHCAGCVSTVEKALAKVEGVEKAVVNLSLEKAVITGNADKNQLIEAVMSSGYTASPFELEILSQDSKLNKLKEAKKRMIVGWSATIPIMVWMAVEMMTGETYVSRGIYNGIMIMLSSVAVFYAGVETIKNGWKSIMYFSPNMDVLITIGCLAAWSTGWFQLWMDFHPLTGIAGMIMSFHLSGRFIESKARGNASSAIQKLMSLNAKEATLIDDSGKETKVDIRRISTGDVIIVRAGETISADGTIVHGIADVDESLVTGESVPVVKEIGNSVAGGTVCLNSTLKIKVEKTGENTFLSQVVRLVENAQTTKVPIQIFADKVVSVFVPVVLCIAGVTFLIWYFNPKMMHSVALSISDLLPLHPINSSPLSQALYAAIAVLVIACPCALGLATPTALMVGTGLGAKNGVLIRDGAAVQKMNESDMICFDKTGTLTEGKLEVVSVQTVDGVSETEIIKLAASIEKESTHPLALAIVELAVQKNIELDHPENVQVKPGQGIEGFVRGRQIKAGTREFSESNQEPSGKDTTVYVSYNGEEKGRFIFKDQIRKEAKDIIAWLKTNGMTSYLLTGDKKGVAGKIAHELGIENVYAEQSPESKLNFIASAQQRGKSVVMVGDGINDAPALSKADVGIAIEAGTDIALESGDVVLLGKGITNITKAFALSKAVFKKIRQNIFWAFAYNVIAIPLAVLGLLHPVIAEIAMAFSSINVVLNSSRLTKTPLV